MAHRSEQFSEALLEELTTAIRLLCCTEEKERRTGDIEIANSLHRHITRMAELRNAASGKVEGFHWKKVTP